MKEGQRGFTLVELLIAIVLLALLTTMLFGGLRAATRHLGQASGRLDRSAQIALVENFLRAQLANAQPLPASGTDPPVLDFAGESDRLAFVTLSPPGVAFGGLQVLSLAFASDGGRLVLSAHPYRGAGEEQAAASSRVLFDHVAEAALAYFGTTSPDEPPRWHDTWRDKVSLPELARLSLVFTDHTTIPELIIALRLSNGA
jgi:general secretion pathway protein J